MKTKITFIAALFLGLMLQAQNIEFTFANTQITNDGTDDFYETDVMIATTGGLADFKLGIGLLYINYNTAAFGSNIVTGGVAEVTYPNPDYILGDTNVLPYYSNFLLVNNTSTRIAFSFQQGLSSGGMTANNVTSTPKKLFHLKIKFINSALDPMVVFEDNETQPPGVDQGRDQFYTACGPSASLALADCGAEPGVQFVDADFVSTGATLSINDAPFGNLKIYPNPTSDNVRISIDSNINKIEIYNVLGSLVITSKAKNISLKHLDSGIYLFKIISDKGHTVKRIIKK